MHRSLLPFSLAALTLGLAGATALASPAAAQGRSPEDTRTIESYRLTMPMLRKVLPAMYAPGARSCDKPKPGDPGPQSLAQMTRMLGECPPVAQSLERAGVSLHDAAIVYAALLGVGREVALRGGKASALPPGLARENALLLEQHDLEIRKLVNTGGHS